MKFKRYWRGLNIKTREKLNCEDYYKDRKGREIKILSTEEIHYRMPATIEIKLRKQPATAYIDEGR